MPLAGVHRIVVDANWRTEADSAVGAARKHHVGPTAAKRLHAGQHVNVIVSRASGAINRQETHSGKSTWIDCPAKKEVAIQIHRGASVKSWSLAPDLRVA